jgi:RimJ/RimL family protein N-acetyltransferase
VPDDAAELFPVLQDVRLHAFVGGEPPGSVEQLRERYERQVVGRSPDGSERWMNWVLRERRSGAAIGYLQATVAGDDAVVAWVVGAEWQGRGYAKESARALVRWLRSNGIAGEITAAISPRHAASIAVARSAGFEPTDRTVDGEVVWRLVS